MPNTLFAIGLNKVQYTKTLPNSCLYNVKHKQGLYDQFSEGHTEDKKQICSEKTCHVTCQNRQNMGLLTYSAKNNVVLYKGHSFQHILNALC